MNEQALFKLTYGLYIVSAETPEGSSGCVVNTLSQVTAEPARLSVAVHKNNYTCELIQKAGRFAAVALDQRADLMTVGRFGFRKGKEFKKFEDIPMARDEGGMPYPLTAVCARYSCRVEQAVDMDTHILFLGRVEEAEILSEEEPLTYQYYRTVIKGGTPENAPSYHKS